MQAKLDVIPEHLGIIQSILLRCLPATAVVYAFGSRVTGRAKTFSDLDLAIDLGEPLSLHLLGELASAFEESPLPYKVDIVDWQSISPSFREHIDQDKIRFPVA